MPLPRVAPMLACAGELPRGDAWAYEVKWDGVRVLAAVEDGRVRLSSRNDNDVSGGYPELAALAGPTPMLLDGEIVAFVDGLPDFGALQARMHVRSPSAELRRSTPVTFVVFDLLALGDLSLMDLPYDERRRALESLELSGPAWTVPPAFHGDGAAVAEATRAQGMEGVVAKRRDSRYEPGRRSDCWVKHKHVRRCSVVVVGWKGGDEGRLDRIGSLLLGVVEDGRLVYAGHVGTGFTAATRAAWDTRLRGLARSAPVLTDLPREHARTAHWVEPVHVVDVDYAAWTRDGRLRHPSYKGLRDDLDPREVHRE